MAALTTLFISTGQTTSHLRARQEAIQLADTAIEQVHAFAPSSLVSGRDAQSVATQFNLGSAATSAASLVNSLSSMSPVSDPGAASGAGYLNVVAPATAGTVCPSVASAPAALHLPTSPVCQAIGTRAFSLNYYLGRCYVALNASDCGSSLPTGVGSVAYLRAVISVSWTNDRCTASSCTYVTSTLLNSNVDPRFDIVHQGPGIPVISAADRVSNVGDTVPFTSPILQSGTGVAPYTWAATGLPPGLSMAADGSITGTIGDQASVSVSYPVTVTVVDGAIQKATSSFVWTVWRPSITAPANQTTVINTPVSLPIVSTCRSTPCTYIFTNGPIGLSINGSGVITGAPTVAGTVTATITVTDSHGISATSAPFRWAVLIPATVCVPEIALANGSFEGPVVSHGAPNWLVGGSSPLLWDTTESDNVIELWKNDGPGPQTGLTAQNANGGMAISAEDGSQWAELNANDVGALYQDLTTVPGQILQWSVWHRGRYSGAANASKKDIMAVQIGSTTSQTSQIPTGQTTRDISDGPTAWVLYRGIYTVPAGQTTTRFQFAAISTASGDRSIGNFIDNLSLNNYVACLNDAPQAQTSTVNTPISSLQLSASRGSGSFTWGGGETLPAGLSISTDGLITGTPTTVGTSAVTLTLTDNQTAFEQSVSFDWTVAPKPAVSAPGSQLTSFGGTVSLQLITSCQNLPCSYAMDGGPAGLSISNTGLITGQVTSGPQTFANATITVRDNAGVIATTPAFSWRVVAAPTFASPGDQKTLRGAAVSLNTAGLAGGGTGGYSYSATGLPPWLSIDSSTGVIGGTAPAATDSLTTGITLTVTDSSNASASTSSFNWSVYARPTVNAPANQTSSVGTPVSFVLASTCPNAPCTYAFSNGPTGLSISSTGAVTGAITGAGANYPTVKVTVTDASGNASTSQAFSWLVNPAPQLANPGNQSTLHGEADTLAMASLASGGTGTYTYTAAGLPSWLSINASTGLISGTGPTGADITTPGITVTLTDSTGASSTTAAFTWTVNNTLAITVPSQSAYKSTVVNLDLRTLTTGGTAPYTYTASGLPSWLSLNGSNGKLTGTAPTVAANSTTKTVGITVTVTDNLGTLVKSTAFNWYVTDLIWTGPAANGSSFSTQHGTSLSGFNASSYITGGSGAKTYSAINLPTGVSVASNGVITGTPSTVGTWHATLSVTDAVGATSVSMITWSVT